MKWLWNVDAYLKSLCFLHFSLTKDPTRYKWQKYKGLLHKGNSNNNHFILLRLHDQVIQFIFNIAFKQQ